MSGMSRLRRRAAAAALLVSIPINVVGIAALAGMYAGFGAGQRQAALALGRTNDILGIAGALLLVPAVVEIGVVTGAGRSAPRAVLVVVGIGALVAIAWLQVLLVTDRLPFEQQIGPVTVAYLVLATWFVMSGRLATRAGVIDHGVRLGVIGATYVGQPWWALRWGVRLLELARPGTMPDAAGERDARPDREAPPAS